MGVFKDSTIISIRDDYISNGKDSFLYSYLLDEKYDEIEKQCKTPNKTEDKVIHKMATDLLYNLGYPLSGKIIPENKRRSQNTALDMIDAWYEIRGNDRTLDASNTESDLMLYQDLYDILNNAHNTSALIPVRIDRETGIGIFIVGRDHYTEFPYDWNVGPKRYCGIGIFSDCSRQEKSGVKR